MPAIGRPTTIAIAENLASGDSTSAQVIQPGRYMVAVGGELDGATVEIWANIGGADFMLTDFEAPEATLLFIPRSTVFARIVDPGAETLVNVACAPVVQRLDFRRAGTIPPALRGKGLGAPVPMR